MNWLIENWMCIFGIAVAVILAVLFVYRFFGMPTEKQKEKIKEWLVWACIEAEKALQSGTGQAKLRKVYDAFISLQAFSWIARIISFETFSEYVNVALVEAKRMIINSRSLAEYVYGEFAEDEVKKLREQIGDAA